MIKRLSRQQKKINQELDLAGIAIVDVYGSKKASPFFLCLSKAMIIFLVCAGTVTGFADAFSLNYSKPTIVLFTLGLSVLISLLYFKKKIFYIGYIAFLIVFTLELLRYYLYANSGFQAITNRVREVYADFFNMSVVRSAEEQITNRHLTITITLIFIIAFLVIMYNITVSRYMNFAETFGISFIILQIPMYIGYKPPLISVIMIMTGCICTGLLQKGAFNRVTIPGKKAPDYIRDKVFKKTYYTTRGSHIGILIVLIASLAFSLFISVFSLPIFDRDLGETPEDSAKAALDDTIKIIVQNGFYGLFNRYDSTNGLNRGVLGGVSSVSPDFKTDLVVSFVPYSKETVYLAGFKGVTYGGMHWSNNINTYDFPELDLEGSLIGSSDIDDIDYQLTSSILKVNKSPASTMQIAYLDKSFGMSVYPYVTYPENVLWSMDDVIYEPSDSETISVLERNEVTYYPQDLAHFIEAGDLNAISMMSSISGETIYQEGAGVSSYRPASLGKGELSGSKRVKVPSREAPKEFEFDDYIYDVCLKVPDALDMYLSKFCREHGYFGVDGQDEYLTKVNEVRSFREKDFSSEALRELVNDFYDEREELNEYRLKVCDAIRDMFLADYPYTLAPGRTPANSDFVQYFLEEQKRGFCSHFASAAVMLLRHMGIPARYIEGYCIPYSLVAESGRKLDKGGDYWFSAENEHNPDKRLYNVEVSDYYAHAWVEVYLEGKGWTPYEFTPPSYEAAPVAQEMTGIGRFFSQILNVDLGFGDSSSESSISVTGDTGTPAVVEEDASDKSYRILILPLAVVLGVVAVFWLLFLLIRKVVLEIRYARYLKEGRFAPLVFARYNELVKRLKRKKMVNATNPLPIELCRSVAEYISSNPKKTNTDGSSSSQDELFAKYLPVFSYIEKVMYSDYKSSRSEYQKYYAEIKTLGR